MRDGEVDSAAIAQETNNSSVAYPVDFAEDIVKAEKFLRDLKQNPKYENETRNAEEHYELYPGTMFETLPDYLKKLEIAMDDNIRSGRNLSYLLNRVLEGVRNMGDPNQTDMFGGKYDLSTEEAVNEQKEKIVDRAIEATEKWKAERAEEARRNSSRETTPQERDKINWYSKTTEFKYAPQSLAIIKEEDYNRFGWAFHNNVLDTYALKVLGDAIADIRRGMHYPRMSDGRYLIATGTKNNPYNRLVVTDGNYENPSIDAVITINLKDESEIADAEHYIYDLTKEGYSYEDAIQIYEIASGERLFSTDKSEDYPSLQALRRQRRDSGKADSSDRAVQDGAGSAGEDRTALPDTRITDTQAPDDGAFSSPENESRSSSRGLEYLESAPMVDTKAVSEAVKNGEATTRDGYGVAVERGDDGAYTVTISKDGKAYTRRGKADAEKNGADIERTAAALLLNIEAGRPNSEASYPKLVYKKKGRNPQADVNVPKYYTDKETGKVKMNIELAVKPLH